MTLNSTLKRVISNISLMTLSVSYLHAQDKAENKKAGYDTEISSRDEYGFHIQATSYSGELNAGRLISTNLKPSINVFYRRSISEEVSVRMNVGAGLIGAAANNIYSYLQPVDGFGNGLAPSFEKVFFDFKYLVEYQFFDFRDEKNRRKYTPYLVGGSGIGIVDGEFFFYIPIGVGMKFILSHKISFEVELLANKTFTDALDDISFSRSNTTGYFGSNTNFDAFFQIGVGVSYRIVKLSCPRHLPLRKANSVVSSKFNRPKSR